jgi:hypothetical protein
LPKDYEEALRESLKAMGTSAEDAPSDPELRASYRRFLLVQRHASTTGEDRQSRLVRAREGATVVTYPDLLAEPR